MIDLGKVSEATKGADPGKIEDVELRFEQHLIGFKLGRAQNKAAHGLSQLTILTPDWVSVYGLSRLNISFHRPASFPIFHIVPS